MVTIIEPNSSSKGSKRICNSSDGMSLLPDEILVSILSCLTLKEAARTSVLSNRWRFLWTYFKGMMDFVLEDWQMERHQFVTTMNEILKLHRGTGVERFRIIFDEIHYSVEDFNNWIEFAAKKSVQRLQLMLASHNSRFSKTACITTPRFLTRICFKSLQALILRFIEVNDETIEYFLTNCPNLQSLDLCHSTCLTNILIPSSSLRLMNLSVVSCKNMRKIEISARNLEEFVYFGPKISIEVKADLNLLRMVDYGDTRCRASLFEGISQLGRSLPLFQLEHLTLTFIYVDYYLFGKYQFTLSKLKSLVLHVDMGNETLNCLRLLEVAPILHTFTVHFQFFWFHDRQGLQVFDNHRIRRHQCLKVVKIVNLLGLPEGDVPFVKTLIDSVESLEKLIVVLHKDCEWHPIIDDIDESMDWNIGELFENGSVPAGTEVIIEEVES